MVKKKKIKCLQLHHILLKNVGNVKPQAHFLVGKMVGLCEPHRAPASGGSSPPVCFICCGSVFAFMSRSLMAEGSSTVIMSEGPSSSKAHLPRTYTTPIRTGP